MRFDPFGRRLSKTVDSSTTYFFYSDEGLTGEFNSQGQVIKTYGFAPNSTWTTDPVFMKQGPNYYFYHNDHLGTTQKMTAVNGAIVWSAKYESFGKARVDSVAMIENNLRFPGQYYDQETGEHYNWNRYYGPGVGRYISPDPIGFKGGTNFFLYVFNTPIKNIDNKGLKMNCCDYNCLVSCFCLLNICSCWQVEYCDGKIYRSMIGDFPIIVWVNHPGNFIVIVECDAFWATVNNQNSPAL